MRERSQARAHLNDLEFSSITRPVLEQILRRDPLCLCSDKNVGSTILEHVHEDISTKGVDGRMRPMSVRSMGMAECGDASARSGLTLVEMSVFCLTPSPGLTGPYLTRRVTFGRLELPLGRAQIVNTRYRRTTCQYGAT